MGNYILTNAADADLEEIGRYTRDNFGMPQATLYLTDLKSAFEMLADHREAGRARPEIAGNLRSYRCSSHLVFYRITDAQNIDVLRVLHHAQDALAIFSAPLP